VLQHLVTEDDVEAIIREVEGVGVADNELDVGDAPFGGEGARLFEHIARPFEACDVPLRNQRGEISGDGSRSAADVEDAHRRLQVWQQEGGRVGGGAPGVRPQHRGVVAVRVSRGLGLGCAVCC